MQPYYEGDGVTLYHGDALDILPTFSTSFQAVIADPPYMIGSLSAGNVGSKTGSWIDMMNAAAWFTSWYRQAWRLTRQASDTRDPNKRIAGCHQTELSDVVRVLPVRTDFGAYGSAIARWESVLGRPAPSPTEPSGTGRPVLSPLFVEWMMGLPAGHGTDPAIGLSRTQQLKALGNGVVPQQAAAALRMLLGEPR